MKNLMLITITMFLATVVFADKPTGVWRFSHAVSLRSTAWYHDGTLIDLGDRQVCHYVGQINFPPNRDGMCEGISIAHLANAEAVEEDGKIVGLHCDYDWTYPVGDYNLSNDVYRENCPDILAIVNGNLDVIGEYWFKPTENQAIYYEDGAPIRQSLSKSWEVMGRFGKKYENQIRYRDTYDWIQLKPGYGWDQWKGPGSAYGTRTSK